MLSDVYSQIHVEKKINSVHSDTVSYLRRVSESSASTLRPVSVSDLKDSFLVFIFFVDTGPDQNCGGIAEFWNWLDLEYNQYMYVFVCAAHVFFNNPHLVNP